MRAGPRTARRPNRRASRRRKGIRGARPLLAAALTATSAGAAPAQDANVHRPAAELEARLSTADLRVTERRTIRPGGRPTDLVILAFGTWGRVPAKWRRAPDGGHEWNNAPRYDLAAYEIQKLFLEPAGYVVPPTALRCLPPRRYARLADLDDPPDATFEGTGCVLVLLQYWLQNVTSAGVWDEDRLTRDTAYARHLANLDVLTHLIEHKDSNTGNFLISTAGTGPRVFAVDNAVSFRASKSPRGSEWRWLRVRRIPRETEARLRSLSRAALHDRLGVLAHFEPGAGGTYRRVESAANLRPERGIRTAGDTVQIGLTAGEIGDVWERIQGILARVDRGELLTF